MEVLSGYVYKAPNEAPYPGPIIKDGKWIYDMGLGRVMDQGKYEEWKTKYFTLEGWDTKTGWPTRKNLEKLDMGTVADELEKHGKLGK